MRQWNKRTRKKAEAASRASSESLSSSSLSLALRKRCDAQLGGGVGNERDRLLWLIAEDGALRERVGSSVFSAPRGQLACLYAQAHWCGVGGEDSAAHFCFVDGDLIGDVLLGRGVVHFERVVPLRGREYLPVGGHAAIAELDPILGDSVGEDERTALDGDGVVEPAGSARRHGEVEFDAIARGPGAVEC